MIQTMPDCGSGLVFPRSEIPELKRLIAHLSWSELAALQVLSAALAGRKEASINFAEAAAGAKLTRSVFSIALQKAAIAGIIRHQSMGVRGTHVWVLQPDWLRIVAEV